MDDIMKTVLYVLEDLIILLKGITKVIEHESKEQRGGF